MTEKEWIDSLTDRLRESVQRLNPSLFVEVGKKVVYAQEVLTYASSGPSTFHTMKYETDILIGEGPFPEDWKPRIVIEGKINTVTTHDAITYSQKSLTHKNVHPYMRYGILLGNIGNNGLPGRLFRHGSSFDFMLAWKEYNPSDPEWTEFIRVIKGELQASRKLERIIYDSRSRNRHVYSSLHRPLKLK